MSQFGMTEHSQSQIGFYNGQKVGHYYRVITAIDKAQLIRTRNLAIHVSMKVSELRLLGLLATLTNLSLVNYLIQVSSLIKPFLGISPSAFIALESLH
jgi:hypothetical protein